MLKHILGNPVVQFLIGRTIGLYLVLAGATTRWEHVNRAAIEPIWAGEQRLVFCVWHGRFTLAHKLWKFSRDKAKPKILVSNSREGEIIAHAARTVGSGVIRGSAAKRGQLKGGVGAMRLMVRHVESGAMMSLTPDGPRGPRMRARMGPVQLSKLSAAPMIAAAWSTKRHIVVQSWDRMIFPIPFSRGVLVYGDPIPAPPLDADDATMEAARLKLEQDLNRVTAEADRLMGAAAIGPAPARELAAAVEAEPAK